MTLSIQIAKIYNTNDSCFAKSSAHQSYPLYGNLLTQFPIVEVVEGDQESCQQ